MPNRRQRRQGPNCSRHRGGSVRGWVIIWACPVCFEAKFPDTANDPDRPLTDQEIETGMRAALGCMKCAKDIAAKDGWEFVDFQTHDHNRYMLFCPHEEELCGDDAI